MESGTDDFMKYAIEAIQATPIPSLLRDHPAVVLERLARGGGATRWYMLRDPQDLDVAARGFAPGSSISFYFDDRIVAKTFSDDVVQAILRIAADDGEAVAGQLQSGGLQIDVDFIAGQRDLDDFRDHLRMNDIVFFGAFPARDNDGLRAVTLDLPDADGVVRTHPH
jgi:hypothetical protein